MIAENITKDGVLTVVERAVKYRGEEKLEYVLYRTEKDGRDSYSIRAVRYKNGRCVCRAAAGDVSSVYKTAHGMFESISEGLVEPYLLCDVVYDLLP